MNLRSKFDFDSKVASGRKSKYLMYLQFGLTASLSVLVHAVHTNGYGNDRSFIFGWKTLSKLAVGVYAVFENRGLSHDDTFYSQMQDISGIIHTGLLRSGQHVIDFNSLASERFQFNFRWVIFKLTLVNAGWGISYKIATHTHTGTSIFKPESSIQASLKWQDGGTSITKYTGLCKLSFY